MNQHKEHLPSASPESTIDRRRKQTRSAIEGIGGVLDFGTEIGGAGIRRVGLAIVKGLRALFNI